MITGGMGFIGSHLSEELLSEKHNLVILTKSFFKKQNITNISKKIKVEKIDVTDFKKLGKSIQKNKPDVIIVDPPRSGLHKNTVDTIIKYTSCKIVYVSCNPSTQARDVNILINNGYSVKNIQPIDMFPHTPHIENITLLTNNE